MAGPKAVVQFEQDDHPALARNLERDLQQARDNEIEGLTGAKDWPDFQKRNGRIDGLNIAISLCQTARKKIEA
jgi:hypothetical protein